MFGFGHTNKLRMDDPQPTSLLDIGAQNVIGKPLDRHEGPLKVTGHAVYSAERSFPDMAYGVLVGARISSGRVVSIDGDAIKAMPGVIDVVTDYKTFIRNSGQGGETQAPTQGVQEIAYSGQVIAIVLGESYEAARDAAIRLPVQYEATDGRYDFDAHTDETDAPPPNNIPAHSSQGDLDQAMAEAAFTVDETFTTPSQNSAAMEPHASVALWEDDRLIVYGAYQIPTQDAMQLADALGLSKGKVRIIAPFIGGGFGSKLGIAPETTAAAIAAKRLGRPVKAVMLRQQVFDATVRRSNTRQRIRLAADAHGRLIGIGHETLTSNLPGEDFFEPSGIATHFLYPGENRLITHDQVRLNLGLSGSMRAPGEASGMLALEVAMDMLAERMEIDPVELRRRNEPLVDPEKDVPFSSRSLQQCLDEGAERFGWKDRDPQPGRRREGEWLIGMGMASATRSNLLQQEEARVRIEAGGRVVIETAMTDIGTGTYSILAQVAGELLGLDPASIDVRMGDSDLPASSGSGGSWGACGSGSAVYLACEELRRQIAKVIGVEPDGMTMKDGRVIAQNRVVPLAEVVGEGLEATGSISPGKQKTATTQASFGAHFAEVAVNAVTGETRVRRMLGVFAAGRILNEKTARSQCLGGMTFGIGAALTEELVHDTRNGKLVNRDLAEYHVPVNADVPQLEVHFVPERDIHANPIHAKGIGELGIAGAGAAIANAIYNACGVRVRDYPLTLDKVMAEAGWG